MHFEKLTKIEDINYIKHDKKQLLILFVLSDEMI